MIETEEHHEARLEYEGTITEIHNRWLKEGYRRAREEELEFLKKRCIYCNVARKRIEELKRNE